jgi:Kef-type K+ transport system membrane component KefB
MRCASFVTLSQSAAWKLEVVTALGVLAAMVVALSIGYVIGRRAGRRGPTWKQRTRRRALGRQAVGLVVLVAASQLQRSIGKRVPMIAGRRLPWPIGR